MRLINTKTRELESFEGPPPAYAILSHTWGSDEVTFQDYQSNAAATLKSIKIDGCCGQALKDGFGYVWIDTCCIDKSSSAELSEAINSMYAWYHGAAICYVYLSDVPGGRDLGVDDLHFRRSRWFTRGWTLQELLAPSRIAFYDQDWFAIGNELKKRNSEGITVENCLTDLVSAITGIPLPYIDLSRPITRASVAERMSWAAKRKTTRAEDIAYCLLGIFNVNMPLLYGEGKKSFVRLQEEIVKEYDDHTLFFWHDQSAGSNGSCFARQPADFGGFGDVRIVNPNSKYHVKSSHYLTTNKGLLIQLSAIQLESKDYVVRFYCTTDALSDGGYEREKCAAIPLVRIMGEESTFYRPGVVRPYLVSCSLFRSIAPAFMYITKVNPAYPLWQTGLAIQTSFATLLTINEIHPPNWKVNLVMATERDLISGSQVIFLSCTDNNKRNIAVRIEYKYSISHQKAHVLCPVGIRCYLALIPEAKSLMELLLLEAVDRRQEDLDWASCIQTGTSWIAVNLTRVLPPLGPSDVVNGSGADLECGIGLRWCQSKEALMKLRGKGCLSFNLEDRSSR
ncbi:heterokaryon incompatibility protein-domain-containing protein [Bisporella sp. PMI_857]|nr:heterokaryon incompatibility protein-domain-containing protein [Bisporella sp. PMI_857]